MSIYNNNIYINETSTLHKASFGFRIHPHQNLDESIKKHEYPGYLKFIKSLKNIDDLRYMRNDINHGIKEVTKISERIDLINKYGDCDKTNKYYNGIKKKYIDKGITIEDCNLYIKWLKEVALVAISERIQELQ